MTNKLKNISTKTIRFALKILKKFDLKDPKNIFIYYIRYMTI